MKSLALNGTNLDAAKVSWIADHWRDPQDHPLSISPDAVARVEQARQAARQAALEENHVELAAAQGDQHGPAHLDAVHQRLDGPPRRERRPVLRARLRPAQAGGRKDRHRWRPGRPRSRACRGAGRRRSPPTRRRRRPPPTTRSRRTPMPWMRCPRCTGRASHV